MSRSSPLWHQGLSEPEDIFALDETGFLKQGNQSVRVQVQDYGTTGHLENCQVGVFDTRFGRWLEESGQQPDVLTVNKQHSVVIG